MQLLAWKIKNSNHIYENERQPWNFPILQFTKFQQKFRRNWKNIGCTLYIWPEQLENFGSEILYRSMIELFDYAKVCFPHIDHKKRK